MASPASPYWAVVAETLLRRLGTSATGLSSTDAVNRLQEHGPNQIRERARLTRLGVLLSRLRSPLRSCWCMPLSIVAADRRGADAVIVLLIIVATVGVGYRREYSAHTRPPRCRHMCVPTTRSSARRVMSSAIRIGEARRCRPARRIGSIVPAERRSPGARFLVWNGIGGSGRTPASPLTSSPDSAPCAYTRYNWFIRRVMKRIAAKAGGDTDTTRDHEYTDWQDLRRFTEQFGLLVARPATAAAWRP